MDAFQPIQTAFAYDVFRGKWDITQTPQDIQSDKMTLFFKGTANRLGYQSKNYITVMWCPGHMDYECWVDKKQTTDRGCKPLAHGCCYEGIPSEHVLSNMEVPILWKVVQESPESPVEISVDLLSVKFEKKMIWKRLCKEYIPVLKLKHCFYRVDFINQKCEAEPASAAKEWRVKCAIPQIVFDLLYETVRQGLSRHYGINVVIPSDLHMDDIYDIWKMIENPWDVQTEYLRRFLGLIYEELFPEKHKNNYHKLCEYLGINPPNSIHKLYIKNPFAIVYYFWLLRLGLKDINAIRMMMKPQYYKYIYGAAYYYKDKLIHNFTLPCTRSGMDFVFYVRWMLRNGKRETVLVKQIVKLLDNEWTQDDDDMLRVFHAYFPVLSDDTKKIVKRRGICKESHDALVHESYAAKIKISKVTYAEKIMNLNMTIGDFSFRVITNTMELPLVGRAMSNCVASYANLVIRKKSIIVVAHQAKEYKICIELNPVGVEDDGSPKQLFLKQALGRFNYRLKDEALEACTQWVSINKIELACNHLFVNEEDSI